MEAHAPNGNVRWQHGGETILGDLTDYHHVGLKSVFLSEMHIKLTHIKNRIKLPKLFPRIKAIDRNVSK